MTRRRHRPRPTGAPLGNRQALARPSKCAERPVPGAQPPQHRWRPVVRALLAWFLTYARDLPWRQTRDPYAIWVSEIMLQQTQVRTVIPYWQRWMRELPTIRAVAKARPERLRKLWEGLGYYGRVRHLQKAARHIVRRHNGRFPADFEAMRALPGIGRYTAGAIASIAFNQPKPVLDGNVRRVLVRLCAIGANPRTGATETRLWQLAEQLVVEASRTSLRDVPCRRRLRGHKRRERAAAISTSSASAEGDRTGPNLLLAGSCSALNQSLMELGATLCTPRNPRCGVCPLARFCAARRLGIASRLPRPGRRDRVERRRLAVFLVMRRGRILACQRPAEGLNARLWELPNVELQGARPGIRRRAREALGIELQDGRPLCVISHRITRFQLRVEVFAGTLARPLPGSRWLTLGDLKTRAFTGLGRKILRLCRPLPADRPRRAPDRSQTRG